MPVLDEQRIKEFFLQKIFCIMEIKMASCNIDITKYINFPITVSSNQSFENQLMSLNI